jgi:serine/threonine protein kinase
MGEESPTLKSDLQNSNENVNPVDALIRAAGGTAHGETTFDPGGRVVAAARAEDRGSIGPYVLVRILGEGGMGQVWLAEQTAPVKRQVALKLIKGGLYGSAVIQRFESERQSLAVMNHPAIAKVFDAGATKDGQPYFVMEYVDGPPITRYCDNKKLKIRERLELFIKVCEGVQHAHQKAIVHRDLKPSNVLVTEVDGKPVPRIIDFGVAKAISSQPGAEQTQFTEMGALIGTRGFISPEQADPNVLDVDTRTDVYSLGALLYVLLTGMLPFDSDGGKKKPIDEVLRQLRAEDPPSPSTKVNAETETATAAAERRGTETKQLAKLLKGDLDWITMKAVEKDRACRYGTPSELAADIERYLENRPVVARPASAGHRLKKYVQRHRVGAAVATGAAALLVAFTVMQAVELRRITRERDRANRITDFMTSMFKVSDPSESRGNTITAREVLDKASQKIDTGLAQDPELQAQLTQVMGSVYQTLGLYRQAESLLDRTVDIRRRVLGSKSPDTLRSASALSYVLEQEGHYKDAEKLQRETLEIQTRVLGPEAPDTLSTKYLLGWTLRREGQLAEATKLDRETLDARRRVLGRENLDTVASMESVAIVLRGERRFPEAESLAREALDTRKRLLGPDNPDTVMSMSNLAIILHAEGRYSEAASLVGQVLEIRRRVLGPEHPDTLAAMNNLCIELRRLNEFTEAGQLGREALDIERRVLGPEHALTLSTMANLANSLASEGKFAEAEELDSQMLQIRQRVLGPEHPDTLTAMGNLASDFDSLGQYAKAEQLQRKALDTMRRALGPENPYTLNGMQDLAGILSHEHRYAEAEKLFLQEIDVRTKLPRQLDLALAWYHFACGAAAAGHRDEALTNLRKSVDLGFTDAQRMTSDKDLKALRDDPRFSSLVAEAKSGAAAPRKSQ